MILLSSGAAWAGLGAPGGGTFWLPPPASTFAADVDRVYAFVGWTSLAFFVALMGAMLWFAVRYRQRRPGERTPDIKGDARVELVWSIFPSFLLLAMFLMGFQTYMDQSVPPADAMEIRVTAQKWRWSYSYPQYGLLDMPVLVVPQGRPVRLTMSSNDVLHSFFVPDFRVKKDVLPNRYTVAWFQVDELLPARPGEGRGPTETGEMTDGLGAGEHQVFCTEFCGTDHSRMYSRVRVLSEEDFDKWVSPGCPIEPVLATPEERGRRLFTRSGCLACHSPTGLRLVGPPLNGLYGRQVRLSDGTVLAAYEAYIQESIEVPGAKIVEGFGPTSVMPPFAGKFTDEQMGDLIAFLKSLQ